MTMKWAEVSIHTTQEAIDAISNILYEVGAGGVVIEDSEVLKRDWKKLYDDVYELSLEDFPEEGVYVKAYFPINSYLMETIEEVKLATHNLSTYDINIGKGEFSIIEVNEEDWSSNWKKYYHPVQVTKHIIVTPVWKEVNEDNKQIVIKLDPGMAFGTGTHPTTVMCIRALEKIQHGDEEVIDVGCGTGVLSIAAAKLGAHHILALDIDQVAVESANLNTELNNVSDRIDVVQNNLLNGINDKVDIIVANILSEVIMKVTSDVAGLLKPNGYFITSGIIVAKADMVKEKLLKEGFNITDTLLEEDWVAFIAQKV